MSPDIQFLGSPGCNPPFQAGFAIAGSGSGGLAELEPCTRRISAHNEMLRDGALGRNSWPSLMALGAGQEVCLHRHTWARWAAQPDLLPADPACGPIPVRRHRRRNGWMRASISSVNNLFAQ